MFDFFKAVAASLVASQEKDNYSNDTPNKS